MRELNINELTTEQKLGIVTIARISNDEKQFEYIIELIKNHSVGAVWIDFINDNTLDLYIKRVKEAADYPILIMCDAESGLGDNTIGHHNALGCADSERLAYIFGKVTANTAYKHGYNVICNPILDMAPNANCACGMNIRALGSDKYRVVQLASAIAQGMHDAGILTVGKHYPSAADNYEIDSHMAENVSNITESELIDHNLYPYIELNKRGLLDGIMTAHCRMLNIDKDYPASLSKKVNDIFRAQGFNGISLTDALIMMGIVTKFGRVDPTGLAIAGGNDLALPFYPNHKFCYESMLDCYKRGLIDDDRLNEAVRRVLDTQRKTLREPKYTSVTEEELKEFAQISQKSIYARVDEGASASVSTDGRHLFVILTDNPLDLSKRAHVDVDTFSKQWYSPFAIADIVQELFPNSGIVTLSQFPTPSESAVVLDKAAEYDDAIFISFFNSRPYLGEECLTARVIAVLNAMAVSDKLSAVVHFGNPYVVENFPHVERLILATGCRDAIKHALDVLAARSTAEGKITYKVNFK